MNRIDFRPSWWSWSAVKQIRDSLQGKPVCFFGGCLRDAMANMVPTEFGLCTSLTSDEILALLEKAGIEASLRGAGMKQAVKAIVGKARFKIIALDNASGTNFLEKVNAYVGTGDFTLNALFMDMEGQVYDNFSAAEDIAKGRVRFLSDPMHSTLQKPEYILRFFRHYAWFGKERPDETALAICLANSELLTHIPPKIVEKEMTSLFSGVHFASAFALMDQRDVISEIFSLHINDHSWLKALEKLEIADGVTPRASRRLMLFLLSSDMKPLLALEHLTVRWKLREGLREEIASLLFYLPYVDERADMKKLGISEAQFNDLLLVRKAIGETAAAESYPRTG